MKLHNFEPASGRPLLLFVFEQTGEEEELAEFAKI